MTELTILRHLILLTLFLVVVFGEQEKKTIIEVPYSETGLLNQILHLDQDLAVREILELEGYMYNKSLILTRNLVNDVTDYLLRYNSNEKKITELAIRLLKSLSEYGSEPEEEITFAQKMYVIHDWIKRSIIGSSFLDWILNKVRVRKMQKDNSSLTHYDFETLFLRQLHGKTSDGELSPEAKSYYQANLLREDMPSFLLQKTNNEDQKRLQRINLNDPEFGYLHVGLQVLRESQLGPEENWSLDDIEDIGVLIESLVRERNMTAIELFELPAKIYYTSTSSSNIQSYQLLDSFYEKYFDYLSQSNPFFQLMKPLNNWKSRPDLAKQVLRENDVTEDHLSEYLNSERLYVNNKGEKISLPSIDGIFDGQNIEVRKSFEELIKLMLFQNINRMNEEEQKFIQRANVSFAKASFMADFKLYNPALLQPGAFVRIPIDRPHLNLHADNIDLFFCEVDNEERTYALDTQNYELHRVHGNLSNICKLYKCTVPSTNSGYKLYIMRTSSVKEERESIDILVEKLSEIHSEKFYKSLKDLGYQATVWQKTKDFLLNFFPFYSCMSELEMGRRKDALVPCFVDISSFIPVVGQGFKLGYKLGSTSFKISMTSINLAAKQVAISQALRQVGKYLLNDGIQEIQKTVNSKVFSNLGLELWHAVDPGVWFIKWGGLKSILAIKKASEFLSNGFIKFKKVAESLVKRSEQISHANLISSKLLKTKQVMYLPDIGQEATVVKIATKNDKDILIRIDPYINIPFGRKYVSSEPGMANIAPIIIKNKIFHLETLARGKKGGEVAVQGLKDLKSLEQVNEVYVIETRSFYELFQPTECLYRRRKRFTSPYVKNFRFSEDIAGTLRTQKLREKRTADKTSLRALECVKEVFRVETRNPNLINTADGCWPFSCGLYEYNLEKHHVIYKHGTNGILERKASAFVSTTIHLDKAINFQHLKDAKKTLEARKAGIEVNENPDDIIGYVYKIRPDSNFYSLREAYVAARDVCPPDSRRYQVLDKLAMKYGRMGQYVALKGFNKDRIIAYAPLKRSDGVRAKLNWIPNKSYNKNYDLHQSSEDLYLRVAIESPSDALYAGANLVQNTLGIDKKAALAFCDKRRTKVMDWVTKYNNNKLEQIDNIRAEYSSYQKIRM